MPRCLLLLAATLVACSPTFNWREVRPPGSVAVTLLPCKPSSESRAIGLAGARVDMTVMACAAGGALWGFGYADMRDPSLVSAALTELAAAARRNVGGASALAQPFVVRGMTPNSHAQRLSVEGKRGDGRPVVSQVALFATGTRVYQLSVVGEAPDPQAVETFFGGVRLVS